MATRGTRPVKIFATDVHRGSLEVAAAGVYDEESMGSVSRDVVNAYHRPVVVV